MKLGWECAARRGNTKKERKWPYEGGRFRKPETCSQESHTRMKEKTKGSGRRLGLRAGLERRGQEGVLQAI